MKCLDRESVVQGARRNDIEWIFNPPFASHHGGVWERMIRTIRRVLIALLHPNVRMTDDILDTVFCEVENIVNSRPLTKLSDDICDSDPLTPNHLLVMNGNFSFPWTRTHDEANYRKAWLQAQSLTTRFWKRWLREYLPELQRRQKWLNEKPNVKVRDIVLISDQITPRGKWQFAKVIEIKPGRDGLVRSVKLSTQKSELVRPITKIVALEGVNRDADMLRICFVLFNDCSNWY